MEYLIKILTGSLFPLLLIPEVSASSSPASCAPPLTPQPRPCSRPPYHPPPRRISTSSAPLQMPPFSHILVYFPATDSLSACAVHGILSACTNLIKLCGHAVCWRVGIGLVQEGLDRGEDGGHVVCRGPAVLKDVQTDAPISVDIRVKHFTHKPARR